MSTVLKVGLLASLLAGAVFGVAIGKGFATDCTFMDPDLTIEGLNAQDTNFDGVATIAEGSYDIDSDYCFGAAEAAALGMCDYIAWPCSVASPPSSFTVDTNAGFCVIDLTKNPVSHICYPTTDNRYHCARESATGPCMWTKFN